MEILRDKNIAPVGSWRYVDPDTGFLFNKEYSNLKELIEHVNSYRSQNNLSQITEEIIMDWLCKQPGNSRYCLESKDISRSFKQVYSGVKAIIKQQISNEFVTQEIAEKRAQICLNCPNNKYNNLDRKDGLYSSWFTYTATRGRRCSLQGKLFTCELCTCILPVKVHYSKKIIDESLDVDTKEKMRLVNCWQFKDVF